MLKALFAATLLLFVSTGIVLLPSNAQQSNASALRQLSDIKLSDVLFAKLKTAIGSFSNSPAKAAQSTGAASVDGLYELLVSFKDDRRSYIDALSNYADVFKNHQGTAGAIYRDEAYYRLTRSADRLLHSLDDFTTYLRRTGLALHRDTAPLDAALEQFAYGKGMELHSVRDSLRSDGFTPEELSRISTEAKSNGEILDSQIGQLQQLLFDKGAKTEPYHMPQ